MHDLVSTGGHVIVFHDGGGDRSQTVAALDRLIPALREAGYEIVPLNELIGVPAASLNPELSRREEMLSFGARIPAWVHTPPPRSSSLFAFTTGIAICAFSSSARWGARPAPAGRRRAVGETARGRIGDGDGVMGLGWSAPGRARVLRS